MQRICEECGVPFQTKPAHVRRGWGRCCSNRCAAALRGRKMAQATIARQQHWRDEATGAIAIDLGRGFYALVDEADFAKVSDYRWHARKYPFGGCYAVTEVGQQRDGKRSRRSVRMHTLIMGKRCGLLVDHKNRNGLDNRRENLRWATDSMNGANSVAKSPGFKGVSWDKRRSRWQAGITINRRRIGLGRYRTAEEAARAYDGAALHFFGEFARTNFADSKPGLPQNAKENTRA